MPRFPPLRRQVLYLRQFKNLKLLNLAGNPISKVGGHQMHPR